MVCEEDMRVSSGLIKEKNKSKYEHMISEGMESLFMDVGAPVLSPMTRLHLTSVFLPYHPLIEKFTCPCIALGISNPSSN